MEDVTTLVKRAKELIIRQDNHTITSDEIKELNTLKATYRKITGRLLTRIVLKYFND